MYATDRKASYKLPPTTIRDKLVSQEMRRTKALDEQKRRRAQKVDSSRQLDLFAGLSLAGPSDDEADDGGFGVIAEEEDMAKKNLAVASVAAYATMLQTVGYDGRNGAGNGAGGVEGFSQPSASTSTAHYLPTYQQAQNVDGSQYSSTSSSLQAVDGEVDINSAAGAPPKTPRKRGGKSSHKRRAEASRGQRGSGKWADKCMYAELLEMSGDALWTEPDGLAEGVADGLPRDLETGWVAVGPVPVGKRCLAVTHNQSSGVAGVVPNTTLRSRLLGKSLLARFPSALPPLTVMDCILDENWRQNGILHVLDVVRWKGQDVSECEAGFRFWWRDTRLAELTQTPPPSFHFVAPSNSSTCPPGDAQQPSVNGNAPQQQQFPYPTTFVPVPYYTSTTLVELDAHIIPAARSARQVVVSLPVAVTLPASTSHERDQTVDTGTSTMDVEPSPSAWNLGGPSADAVFQFGGPPGSTARANGNSAGKHLTALAPATATVQPDGLLLYVAEASYEPGTSPLSSWIPIRGYGAEGSTNRLAGEREGPLDLFHRLVQKRMACKSRAMSLGGAGGDGMDMDI